MAAEVLKRSPRPLVSVLMPAYNAERWLQPALDSILRQTLGDFECIVIDDGSADGTSAILNKCPDSRLRILKNQTNQGVTASLNRGAREARGRYLARMDADDLSQPQRLERQVDFLANNPTVGVCGCWIQTMEELPPRLWRYPTEPAAIRARLLFESALAHPAVVMRAEIRELFPELYTPEFPAGQDYDLWVRLCDHTELANLPETLLLHRLHPERVGIRQAENQEHAAIAVRTRQLRALGINPTAAETALHNSLAHRLVGADREFLQTAEAWLLDLASANRRCGLFQQESLEAELGDRWLDVCRNSMEPGSWVWKRFRGSRLSRWSRPGWRKIAGFAGRSLLPRASFRRG